MNCPSLEIEYLKPRTVVCFSECSPLWLTETQRQLEKRFRDHSPYTMEKSTAREWEAIDWKECSTERLLDQPWIQQSPLVVLAMTQNTLQHRIKIIHRITHMKGKVAVIGDRGLKNFHLPLTAAGTVALVTDIFDCQRLAFIIQQMSQSRHAELTGWKTRFVNRLPWPPV